jgi:hypothetical protein
MPLGLCAWFQASKQPRLSGRVDCLASIPLPFVRPAILPFVGFLVGLRSAAQNGECALQMLTEPRP